MTRWREKCGQMCGWQKIQEKSRSALFMKAITEPPLYTGTCFRKLSGSFTKAFPGICIFISHDPWNVGNGNGFYYCFLVYESPSYCWKAFSGCIIVYVHLWLVVLPGLRFYQMYGEHGAVGMVLSFYAFILMSVPMLWFVQNTISEKVRWVPQVWIFLLYGNAILQEYSISCFISHLCICCF